MNKFHLNKAGIIMMLALFFLVSCSFNSGSKHKAKVSMGYILNITHAVPIIALEKELFGEEIKHYHFSSGGYLLNSLLTENIDAAFIGPGPYINAIDKGVKLKLLGSYAYGANSLILSKKFQGKDLSEIKKLRMAVPQFGNTQDLLAKMFLDDLTDEYIAIAPAELEFAFFTESVDAALVSEPWASVLTKNGLVNANSLFKERLENINKFPSTLLVINDKHYKKNKQFYNGFQEKIDSLYLELQSGKDFSKEIENHFYEINKKSLEEGLVEKSLEQIDFKTNDNLEFYLSELRKAAVAAKYLKN
ncbi:MAG: ABC transporter substrate-binding protein [Candidatus Caenarcaniphilales bacterium]|nr:ABC transporter substrate-binding protein [Candidatus Caenarcaniphilales bacterium]